MQKSWIKILVLMCGVGLMPFARALVILQYHHISDSAPKATSISPALFEAQLKFIEDNKFRVISADELKKSLSKKGSIPDGAVLITFDDGYRSIYSEAFPRLKERSWPFVIFVNSKPHDEKNPRYLSWDQLREMAKNGATIANHTDSHPHMIRRKSAEDHRQWLSRMEAEIDFAEKRIKKEVGKSTHMFAWPYGEYNRDLRLLLKKKKYLGFGQQSGPVSKYSDLQVIPRFPVGGVYGSMDEFPTKIFSLPLPITNIETESSGSGRFVDPQLPKGVDIPVLRITTPLARYIKNFKCYASGQGEINTTVQSSTIVVKAKTKLPIGRSRYNCTADAGGGRYYWYSQLFIKLYDDGRWYAE